MIVLKTVCNFNCNRLFFYHKNNREFGFEVIHRIEKITKLKGISSIAIAKLITSSTTLDIPLISTLSIFEKN